MSYSSLKLKFSCTAHPVPPTIHPPMTDPAAHFIRPPEAPPASHPPNVNPINIPPGMARIPTMRPPFMHDGRSKDISLFLSLLPE